MTSHEQEAWRKHVVEGMWIVLAILIAFSVALTYGNTHGWFSRAELIQESAWPAGWP